MDPWKNRTQFSNVYFPNADELRSFKASLDVRLHGTPRLDHSILGFSQTFEGTANDQQVQGTVSVTSSKSEVAHSARSE